MQDRLDRLERDLTHAAAAGLSRRPGPVSAPGSARGGRYRTAHGPAGDPDARADRARRGRGERGRAAAPPARADQQRHRRAIQPRPGPGQSKARRRTRTPAAGFRRNNRSPAGQIAMRGPSPAAARLGRGCPPIRCRPAPLVPPPPDRPSGAGTLTPPVPPGAPQPVPDTLNVATVGEFPAARCAASCLPVLLPRSTTRHSGLLKQADYPAAEEALKTFVAQHPKDPLAGSAQYWLGETYYARGQIRGGGQRLCRGLQELSEGDEGGRRSVETRHVARPRQPEAECLRRVRPAGSRLPATREARSRSMRSPRRSGWVADTADRQPSLFPSPSSQPRSPRSHGSKARRFSPLPSPGGPDSLALAILADRWARERGGQICALTVDHRLRPESGDEIRRLRAWLSARAIRHEVLVWTGAKPTNRYTSSGALRALSPAWRLVSRARLSALADRVTIGMIRSRPT